MQEQVDRRNMAASGTGDREDEDMYEPVDGGERGMVVGDSGVGSGGGGRSILKIKQNEAYGAFAQ